jgi:hypothetical protein
LVLGRKHVFDDCLPFSGHAADPTQAVQGKLAESYVWEPVNHAFPSQGMDVGALQEPDIAIGLTLSRQQTKFFGK